MSFKRKKHQIKRKGHSCGFCGERASSGKDLVEHRIKHKLKYRGKVIFK